MKYSWTKYYEKTKHNPPRPLLVQAIPYMLEKGAVIDVGAGALVDSRYLLEQGFSEVTALDADDTSYNLSLDIKDDRFNFVHQSFVDYIYPENYFDLVSGQYAFSFIPKESFQEIFSAILKSVKINGILSGNFFGDKDGWNTGEDFKTYLNKVQCLELFNGWEILFFEEKERDDTTALGVPKHWHELNIIARRLV